MKGRIVATLFALPFFSVGLWMLWSLSMTFHDAYQMRSWVPVEAQVLSAGYRTNSGDDSDTYKAYVEYRYSYGGAYLIGDRVAIGSGSDNIGSYQQDMGNRLSRARANGTPIMVYVNPGEPTESIVDRDLRWGMIGFKSIFLFVFGGVGLFLLIAVWRAPKEKDDTLPQ